MLFLALKGTTYIIILPSLYAGGEEDILAFGFLVPGSQPKTNAVFLIVKGNINSPLS